MQQQLNNIMKQVQANEKSIKILQNQLTQSQLRNQLNFQIPKDASFASSVVKIESTKNDITRPLKKDDLTLSQIGEPPKNVQQQGELLKQYNLQQYQNYPQQQMPLGQQMWMYQQQNGQVANPNYSVQQSQQPMQFTGHPQQSQPAVSGNQHQDPYQQIAALQYQLINSNIYKSRYEDLQAIYQEEQRLTDLVVQENQQLKRILADREQAKNQHVQKQQEAQLQIIQQVPQTYQLQQPPQQLPQKNYVSTQAPVILQPELQKQLNNNSVEQIKPTNVKHQPQQIYQEQQQIQIVQTQQQPQSVQNVSVQNELQNQPVQQNPVQQSLQQEIVQQQYQVSQNNISQNIRTTDAKGSVDHAKLEQYEKQIQQLKIEQQIQLDQQTEKIAVLTQQNQDFQKQIQDLSNKLSNIQTEKNQIQQSYQTTLNQLSDYQKQINQLNEALQNEQAQKQQQLNYLIQIENSLVQQNEEMQRKTANLSESQQQKYQLSDFGQTQDLGLQVLPSNGVFTDQTTLQQVADRITAKFQFQLQVKEQTIKTLENRINELEDKQIQSDIELIKQKEQLQQETNTQQQMLQYQYEQRELQQKAHYEKLISKNKLLRELLDKTLDNANVLTNQDENQQAEFSNEQDYKQQYLYTKSLLNQALSVVNEEAKE